MNDKNVLLDNKLLDVSGGDDSKPAYIFRKDVEYRKNRGWSNTYKKCAMCKKQFISWYGENICEVCDDELKEKTLVSNQDAINIVPVIDDFDIKWKKGIR